MAKDGGPAFPEEALAFDSWGDKKLVTKKGMTLHQWYAGKALEGLCANPNLISVDFAQDIANGIRGGRLITECSKALANSMLTDLREKRAKNAQKTG